MNAPPPPAVSDRPAAVELHDVQGLLKSGFGHHREAAFLLLRVKDAAAARAWLAEAPVTTALDVRTPPRVVLQVALTADGLAALGVADDIVQAFPAEFLAGMDDADRARRLGDVGDSAPGRWRWGAGDHRPHLLLLLYAVEGELAPWRQAVLADCADGFDLLATLDTAPLDRTEPFGFVDGLSDPQPDWARERPVEDRGRTGYDNLVCLGEFLLGHPNEYGRYTERPLLDPGRVHGRLPRAEDAPDRADLGRNGSFLVLRQLKQDVAGFWQYLDRQAGGDADQRRRLAEAMVGRTMDGRPLVGRDDGRPLPGDPDDGGEGRDGRRARRIDLNAFTYRSDPEGLRCPLGAHIRRANPRNADLPPGTGDVFSWSRLVRTLGFDADALRMDHVASTRFHRLLRRGRKYGPVETVAQALAAPAAAAAAKGGGTTTSAVSDPAMHGGDGTGPGFSNGTGAGLDDGTHAGPGDGRSDAETGLHFICLGANIVRQFEFVQTAWLNAATFDRLHGESDPLLGDRRPAADGHPTDTFSMPRTGGPDHRLDGLPRFVTVVGGAYFFLPGLRALRYLATAA